MIIFVDEGHIYSYKGTKLMSVTTYIDTLKPEFDEEFQIRCMGLKRLIGEDKYRLLVRGILGRSWNLPKNIPDLLLPLVDKEELAIITERVRREWELAGLDGTAFHKMLEAQFYEAGVRTNVFSQKEYPVIYIEKQHDNQSLLTDLYLLEDGYYSELLVWDMTEPGLYVDKEGNITDQEKYDEAMSRTIVGQVDEVWIETIDNVRYIDTNDHKTNKKAPTEFKGTARHPSTKYYPPLDYMFDNKVTSYNLQGNMYQYLLTTFGFVSRECAYTHYSDYDESTGVLHTIPNLSGEIKTMMEAYHKK